MAFSDLHTGAEFNRDSKRTVRESRSGGIAGGIDVKLSEGPDGERGKLFGWLSSTQNQLIYKPRPADVDTVCKVW